MAGSFVTTAAVDEEWARRVFEFLAARPRPVAPTFTAVIDVAGQVERDPLFERAPHSWRGLAAWVRRLWGYSWREATGALRERPAERWQLSGVRLWNFSTGWPGGEG